MTEFFFVISVHTLVRSQCVAIENEKNNRAYRLVRLRYCSAAERNN